MARLSSHATPPAVRLGSQPASEHVLADARLELLQTWRIEKLRPVRPSRGLLQPAELGFGLGQLDAADLQVFEIQARLFLDGRREVWPELGADLPQRIPGIALVAQRRPDDSR